jgi:DNA-binding NarL/FixJ family response regulator
LLIVSNCGVCLIMTKKIKIALIDDEVLFLEGIIRLFDFVEDIEIVLTANDGQSFLAQLASAPPKCIPDIVISDIRMQPIDGFELVEKLKHSFPKMHLIILSSHYKNAIFGHMIKLGVAAFLPKNVTQELLLKAIRKVYTHGTFFSERDQEMLMSFVQTQSPKRYFSNTEQLTLREKEILQLICKELTNIEIAEQLFLSKRTVENHRQNLLEKTGVKNTAGLVIYAICHELFLPEPKNYF